MNKILSLVVVASVLLTACSSILPNIEYPIAQERMSQNVDDFIYYIHRNEDDLLRQYGKPDSIEYLYGGATYYYEEMDVAFGIDNGIVNSVLIYSGELNEDININMSYEKAMDALNIESEQKEVYDDTLQMLYGKCECYLTFYNGVLVEIMLK